MFFSFTSNGSLRRIATPERFVTPRLSLAHIPYIKTFFFLKKWYALSKIKIRPHSERLCEYLSEAEVGKPKSNWELQDLLGLAAFILGFLAGK